MQILTVDVGTGTQDIFLYDSRLDLENGYKLIVPSPTMMIYRRIRQATQRGEAILLTGETMGGGPSHWAAERHIKAGYPVYATPDAARSFNDDLAFIREMGITLVSADEAAGLPPDVHRIRLRDFDFQTISEAFDRFGVSLKDLDAVAVAVFDHGAAPPNFSDRQFRFDYLDARIQEADRLTAFAYPAKEVPAIMTRMQAVADSARDVDAPLYLMDTAPAAILGGLFDPLVAARARLLITNVGNFHTLAFRLGPEGIEGVFEHHTGLLDRPKFERLLRKFAQGTLAHEEIFEDNGHGALIYRTKPYVFPKAQWGIAVTGPRRSMMEASPLRPHFPAPFGDMMIVGCIGLLAAVAEHAPALRDALQRSLSGHGGRGTPPWEVH